MTNPPKPRRFQFTLRRMLTMVTLLCAALGALWHFVIGPAERQRGAVQMVQRLGGQAHRGYPWEEFWLGHELRRWLPLDYLTSVGGIELDHTDAEDEDIARLRGLPLGALYVRGTRLTDAGMAHVQTMHDLTVLDLSETRITDLGLARLGELSQLQSLFLDGTGVTDSGLESLVTTAPLHNLSLRQTAVTDAGLVHLAKLPDLKTIDLTETQVTPAGIAKFKKAVPGCLVVGQKQS
jgi:hypothetical protein